MTDFPTRRFSRKVMGAISLSDPGLRFAMALHDRWRTYPVDSGGSLPSCDKTTSLTHPGAFGRDASAERNGCGGLFVDRGP